jgi:hypothetical protein
MSESKATLALNVRLKPSDLSAHPRGANYTNVDVAQGIARGMSNRQVGVRCCMTVCLVLIVGVAMNAEAGLFGFGGDTWQEEVLLHDGRKVVITRSQTYGGRHEIGQPPPIKEHTITFTLPESDKRITWTSEYDENLGRTNFNLLALHVLNGTPYIVAEPNLILSYNKWGRPNPPYVFFKYDGTAWKRIPLEEFPAEFRNINLVINTIAHGAKLKEKGLVSSEAVKKLNDSLMQPEYKTIVRTPLDHWKPRPEYKGPKAPCPIIPPGKADGKK